MGKKKFDTPKAVKDLFENLGENETLLVLHDNGGELNIGVSDKKDVTAAIAAIITTSLQGKGDDGIDALTDIILDAVKLVRQSPIAGLILVNRELEDTLEEWKREMAKDTEPEEEEHPCEGCADILTCMDKDAIDYRKKHHLPKPKKGKKSK